MALRTQHSNCVSTALGKELSSFSSLCKADSGQCHNPSETQHPTQPGSLLMSHLPNPLQRCSHRPPWLLCSTPLLPHGCLDFRPFSPLCHVWLMDYMWLASCWANSNPSRALAVTLAAFATPSSVQSSANIINLLFTFAFRSLIKTLNKPGMCCFFSNFF